MKRFFSIGTDKDTGLPYSQWVDETGESSCSCSFGSWHGKTKKNKGKVCRHVAEAFERCKKI